uniref:NADH dehydrogenase subunit 4L n=1 Tax=Pyemotes zhonghuajia TaxID=2749944 RepID=A0A8T9JDB3_9ACAR|nr:NADH dehydrogenase subunit 4L [Pyemotes zhonghuajia]UOK09669.1 NADH dehydrogenase subunit 4L [Pyemotes zhonghuajia]
MFFYYIILMWLFKIFFIWKNFYFLLLCFEGLMMTYFMCLVSVISFGEGGMEILILFLSFLVIESSVGLMLMIKGIFWYGEDLFFMNFSY